MFTDSFSRPRTVAGLAREMQAPTALLLRWLGTVIDLIILLVVGLTLGVFVGMVAALTGGRGANSAAVGAIVIMAWVAEVLAYYIISEGLWGRTLGKLVTGLVVVDGRGAAPGFGRATVRTLLRLIEVNPFLIGGIPAAIAVMASSTRQRLGDMAAGTYVVSRKELGGLNQAEAAAFD